MALALQSRASEVFAVDIHPGARIGGFSTGAKIMYEASASQHWGCTTGPLKCLQLTPTRLQAQEGVTVD